MLKSVVDRLSLQQLEYEMERADIPDDCNCFEIGYFGHPDLPYANIQLEQGIRIIISYFQEEDHPFIHDTLNNRNK